MTNKEIARTFQKLGDLMELHQENPYKIRSYKNAYIALRKLQQPLSEMTTDEMRGIKGVGKAIADKIEELLTTGDLAKYREYAEQTPEGVLEMLDIKGFGPKKIRTIWKDMGVETIGELQYACVENRLVKLKGFGPKTQADLYQKITYYLQSRDKYHYATLEGPATDLLTALRGILPNGTPLSLCGEMRRLCPVVHQIDVLVGDPAFEAAAHPELLTHVAVQEGYTAARTTTDYPVRIYTCPPEHFGSRLFVLTSERPFLEAFVKRAAADDFKRLATEEAVFEKADLPYILPERREGDEVPAPVAGELIEGRDIRGVVHSHSTYSDGLHTLEEMATYSRGQGYEYLLITDHSQAAFYANGLKPDRVHEQWAEVDRLNAQYSDFRILKGIECDILNSGDLDYDDELLAGFDCVIASVHSNLKMDKTKATNRILKAIENPYTHILGHPTGRLLLSREGYPLDMGRIIDACAANGVHIELNAHPYRLDLDWQWLPYALEKGIKISINPDAHAKEGIHHIRYGVLAARKGGLTAEGCLNAVGVEGFLGALRG